MQLLTKLIVGLTACFTGGVIGFGIYYDYKRRQDPNYKQKVYELRLKREGVLKDESESEGESECENECEDEPEMQKEIFNEPNQAFAINSPAELFFYQKIEQAEILLANHQNAAAVECLFKAMRVCRNMPTFLQTLKYTLPPDIFSMLVRRVREAQRMGCSDLHSEDSYQAIPDMSVSMPSIQSNISGSLTIGDM